MGIGNSHFGLGECGCGCATCPTSWETSYSDSFDSGTPTGNGWTFNPGGYFVHANGRLRAEDGGGLLGNQAFAYRNALIDYHFDTHVENEVEIYLTPDDGVSGENQIFLINQINNPSGGPSDVYIMWGTNRANTRFGQGGFRWQIKDDTKTTLSDESGTPNNGDIIKITMDLQTATIDSGSLVWDLDFLVNGISKHTDTFEMSATGDFPTLGGQYCNIRHGLQAYTGFDLTFFDVEFEDYSLSMS